MLIVRIHNTGQHPQSPVKGSYTYDVYVNRRLIARGNVAEHNRTDGWASLVALVAKDGLERGELEP